MRFNSIMGKVSKLALLLTLLSTLFIIGGNSVTTNAAEIPVQMYSSNYSYEACGGASWYNGTIYVKVSNNGIYNSTNKKVTVDALTNNYPYGPSWKDYSCQYVGNLNDGYQLWKCSLTSSFDCNVLYSIKYEVNGGTYLDTNTALNYTQNNTMGAAVVKVNEHQNDTGNSQYSLNNINVSLKNLGTNKVARVRYTEDNWATWRDANLSYVKTNQDSSEEWGCYINHSNYSIINNFHYAVYYQVNGQTYWDNNFGRNYNYTF